MSDEKREREMMAEAKAYTSEIYDDESADFKTEEKIAETIADFCAGWKAADKSRWIPVDRELPVRDPDIKSVSIDVIATDGKVSFESYYHYNTHEWENARIMEQPSPTGRLCLCRQRLERRTKICLQ